ncbi:MAG: DUF368 domain-containing protein [Traorella sp.]
MLRNIIGGIAVGIANVIPGVSGGTMMVILGIFNHMNEAIAGVFKVKNDHRKEDIWFLLQVAMGAVIGLVGFANVLNYTFVHYQIQTMFWFVGLVAFSIPVFMKKEMKGLKVDVLFLLIGMVIVFGIDLLAGQEDVIVNPSFPSLSGIYLIRMVFDGLIAGFTMFLPGVSGSMVLLIIGDYYLFKSLLASALTFQLNVLIPLAFMGIGIVLGIIIAAKLITYLLKKNAPKTLSLLLGLVICSAIVLVPFNVSYDPITLISSGIALLFGGIIVYLMNKFA